jgi:hypothetical protein
MTLLANEWATGLRTVTATGTDDAVASLWRAGTHATRLVSQSMRRATDVITRQQELGHRQANRRPSRVVLPIVDVELTRC